MHDRIAFDAAFAAKQIQRLIDLYPDLAEDEVLAADMFEGETDLLKVVTRAVEALREADGLVEATKARENAIRVRRDRFQRRADAMKALIRSLMDTGGLRKLVLPEATISAREPMASVEVQDINELPQGYTVTIPASKQADKKAIAASLKAGETVPGAILVYGEPGITIRSK